MRVKAPANGVGNPAKLGAGDKADHKDPPVPDQTETLARLSFPDERSAGPRCRENPIGTPRG
jgi:hypothetical protein